MRDRGEQSEGESKTIRHCIKMGTAWWDRQRGLGPPSLAGTPRCPEVLINEKLTLFVEDPHVFWGVSIRENIVECADLGKNKTYVSQLVSLMHTGVGERTPCEKERAMGGISISYRRDDSTGWAGRLSEHLKGRLGQEALLSGDAIEPDVHDTNALHAYDAFISYSRKDEAFASALEKALEAYTPPKDLKVPQRPLDIFRDKEDFTGNDYVQSLEKYLHCSSKLIVLCSPSARQSPFVNDEIRRFAKAKGSKHSFLS